MNDVQGVGKNSKNTQQGFMFRGIDAVINAVGPAFRKHGVIAVPELLNERTEVITTSKGGTMSRVCVEVAYVFYGSEGDSLKAIVAAEAFDSGDKATAKAMSVAYRTALLQVLCLPTDEPDPDSYTYERTHSREQATPIEKPATDLDLVKQMLTAMSKDAGVRKQFVLDALGVSELTSLNDLGDNEIAVVLKKLNEAMSAPFTN
jgi:hypothetical protein